MDNVKTTTPKGIVAVGTCCCLSELQQCDGNALPCWTAAADLSGQLQPCWHRAASESEDVMQVVQTMLTQWKGIHMSNAANCNQTSLSL